MTKYVTIRLTEREAQAVGNELEMAACDGNASRARRKMLSDVADKISRALIEAPQKA